MNNRLTGLVRRTPLFLLADQPHLACKIEACQTSGSFKVRGAVRVLFDEVQVIAEPGGVVGGDLDCFHSEPTGMRTATS